MKPSMDVLIRFALALLITMTSSTELFTQAEVLREIAADEHLKHASIGIEIVNLGQEKAVISVGHDLAIAPASTMKVATTAAALDVLGSDFRFRSQLGVRGTSEGGTLKGDLVLSSDGDPTLASRHLNTPDLDGLIQSWVNAVRSAGIIAIEGDVVIDASYYGRVAPPGSWQYQDLGNYYGSGAYSFNLHDNLYVVEFTQRDTPGQGPNIRSVRPEQHNLKIRNEVITGAKGSGDQAYIYGAPYQSQVTIRGTIPPGGGSFEIKGSITDPPLFAAHQLHQALEQAGIDVTGKFLVEYARADDVKVIWQQESVPLRDITDATNRLSVNLFAEALGLRMEKYDTTFSLEDYWIGRGLSVQGINFADYSGLSKNNVVTASFMSELLNSIYRRPQLFEAIKKGLSIAGQTGTMRSMLRNSPARGRVWGKSGSIAGVRCYVGYLQAKSGAWLSFALLAQNYTCSSTLMRKKFANLLEEAYLTN